MIYKAIYSICFSLTFLAPAAAQALTLCGKSAQGEVLTAYAPGAVKVELMDELKKIVKVIKKIIPDAPHATLLTIDATTGQNALNQVKTFKEMVDVSGLIVTKLDGTAKGGIIVAVAEETGIPIHYIGIGEGIDDLDEFNARDFAQNLLEIK
jgi:signal recognition particle GTPase